MRFRVCDCGLAIFGSGCEARSVGIGGCGRGCERETARSGVAEDDVVHAGIHGDDVFADVELSAAANGAVYKSVA